MPPVFDPRVFDPRSHEVEDATASAPEVETPLVEGDSDETARREEV